MAFNITGAAGRQYAFQAGSGYTYTSLRGVERNLTAGNGYSKTSVRGAQANVQLTSQGVQNSFAGPNGASRQRVSNVAGTSLTGNRANGVPVQRGFQTTA